MLSRISFHVLIRQRGVTSDLKEIEFLLYQGKDSNLKDSIVQTDLANLDDYFVDPTPEMFIDEHAPDYSSPPIFYVYDDDFLEVESDVENIYNDPFNSKGEKTKESKLLIDELDLPCDFHPPREYDSFISQDFFGVDALPSTDNEDKIFNPGILIQEKPVEINTRVVQDKKLVISNASSVFADFDTPFYEPLFFKEVPKSKMLLPFYLKMRKKFSNQGYTFLKKFMNYLEEQTDEEAMINSIKNGDQLLPRVTQVSLAGTSSTEQPLLKDKSMWSDQEKKIHKIDRLARSLLIQGLPNNIYSLIDNNKTAKDLWDALAMHMLGFEYGEQDRKAAVLYEYETFKVTEGEQLLDTYLRYLQVINDLKKCGYKKDNCELNYKFLNNLKPEWKQYGTLMRQTKNLMDINIDALYSILKQNQGEVNDALGYKKKAVVVTSDPLALVAEKTKKPEYVKSVKKKEDKKVDENKRDMSKVKCYNSKKDSDEQVLLAEDQAWMESSSDSDQEINANMVFMAKIEKVLSYSEESFSSAEETIAEVAYYTSKSESESEYETSKYYDNSTNYGLFVNDNDNQEIFHDAIESASENFIENHIDSQKDYDKSEVNHNDSEEKDHLVDKLI
nr:hypothetical protein [Tanacetum cinerariifolium]